MEKSVRTDFLIQLKKEKILNNNKVLKKPHFEVNLLSCCPTFGVHFILEAYFFELFPRKIGFAKVTVIGGLGINWSF